MLWNKSISHLLLLVEVDSLDLVHGGLEVAVSEQLLVRRDIRNLWSGVFVS